MHADVKEVNEVSVPIISFMFFLILIVIFKAMKLIATEMRIKGHRVGMTIDRSQVTYIVVY